jgi:hypothetical protein
MVCGASADRLRSCAVYEDDRYDGKRRPLGVCLSLQSMPCRMLSIHLVRATSAWNWSDFTFPVASINYDRLALDVQKFR